MKGVNLILMLVLAIVLSAAAFAQSGPPVPPPPPAQDDSTFQLNIERTGSGKVTGLALGIECPPDCSLVYDAGKSLILTAVPNLGAEFASWSGDVPVDCTTGICSITMDKDRTITAIFTGSSEGLPLDIEDESKMIYFIVIIAAIVIAVIAIVFFFIKKAKKQTPKEADPRIKAVRIYVVENLKKGYSKEQIRHVLIQSGYPEYIINEVMKGV